MFAELTFRVYLHFISTVVPLAGVKLDIGQFLPAILGEVVEHLIPTLLLDTLQLHFLRPLQSTYFNMELTGWKAATMVQKFIVGVLATLLEHLLRMHMLTIHVQVEQWSLNCLDTGVPI